MSAAAPPSSFPSSKLVLRGEGHRRSHASCTTCEAGWLRARHQTACWRASSYSPCCSCSWSRTLCESLAWLWDVRTKLKLPRLSYLLFGSSSSEEKKKDSRLAVSGSQWARAAVAQVRGQRAGVDTTFVPDALVLLPKKGSLSHTVSKKSLFTASAQRGVLPCPSAAHLCLPGNALLAVLWLVAGLLVLHVRSSVEEVCTPGVPAETDFSAHPPPPVAALRPLRHPGRHAGRL